MVNEFFEKFLNNMLVDHLEKIGFFLIFSMVSGLLIQWLTIACDRTVKAFTRCGGTQAVALDISNNFDRIWHTGLF